MRREQEPLGHLYFAKKPGQSPFPEEDARAVELLAAFAGVAIENAKLYGALRREVAAREDLLSMVSHDLRTPLSAVRMAAQLVNSSLDPEMPAGKQTDIIVRSAQ